jgi:hypothetical protein
MLQQSHKYGIWLVTAFLVLVGLAGADDKDKPALKGIWARTEGELKIKFADKNVMKISPHGDDDLILIACDYTLKKDGLVKAKITEIEGKAKDKVKELLPVGLEFTFTWKAKDASATLDDVKGDKVDLLKEHLEGKFELKK